MIAEVLPGSSAAGAGLVGIAEQGGRLGDVITAVNGKRVDAMADLAALLDEIGIGNEVELTLIRDGRERSVRLPIVDIS